MSRIVLIETAPALTGQKRPRIRNEPHLAFIRQLPCVICGARNVEAAHIRMGSRIHGKRETGLGERPTDFWCVPLCAWCHRLGPQSQHNMGEREYWAMHNIEPCGLALSLFGCGGNSEVAEVIIQETRAKAGADHTDLHKTWR